MRRRGEKRRLPRCLKKKTISPRRLLNLKAQVSAGEAETGARQATSRRATSPDATGDLASPLSVSTSPRSGRSQLGFEPSGSRKGASGPGERLAPRAVVDAFASACTPQLTKVEQREQSPRGSKACLNI